MQLISHQVHLDALPASDLKFFLQARYNQLSEDTGLPPNIVVTEDSDQINGPDFGFVGSNGLLSDLFEVHKPGHPEFARPYEWVSFIPELETFEFLLLTHGEDGVLIYVSRALVDANPDLHWVLTSEEAGGLSPPQPLY